MKFNRILLAALVIAGASEAVTIPITDTKGRTVQADLVTADDKNVTFKLQGSAKEHTLPLSQLDETSRELIRSHAARLPKPPPKLNIKVNIGKRRGKYNGSSYQVQQDITCNIDVTNSLSQDKTPPLKARILFIGRDRRTPDVYKVLSVQDFNFEVAPGETRHHDLKEFHTTYDSDNKGYGNIGGFQYDGYLLVITDDQGTPILHQSLSGNINKAVSDRRGLLEDALKLKQGTEVSASLVPLDR